jgi:hypothetical protein
MFRLAAILFASFFIVATAQAADMTAFQPGQMWTVKNSDIRIVVGRVEPFVKGKTAVSISVLNVPCPPEAGCKTTVVAHAPFDAEVLADSVDELVSTSAQTAPQFDQGYANWKQAHGGVFTVPVSKLPELLFKATGTTHISNQ